MPIFPFFKKSKTTNESLNYDNVMMLKRADYSRIMELLDKAPDEYKHLLTSESFNIYVETLENIYMSRYSWKSPYISDVMLDNIEKFLLSDKKCAILREKRIVNGITIYSDNYGVYNFTVSRFSPDQETPLTINIQNKWSHSSESQYSYPEFIIIKDFSSWKSFTGRKSISSIISDYASKLSLIDNVIDANMYKHKLPLHVKGKIESNNSVRAYFKELYRNALYMFDGGGVDNNFTIESPAVEFIIDKLQEHKEKVMQEFCAMIGVSNSQNYSDVYQNIEQVKLNSSFVFNVAQSHFINRKKLINKKMADYLMLDIVQNDDIYGKVDLIKPDSSSKLTENE